MRKVSAVRVFLLGMAALALAPCAVAADGPVQVDPVVVTSTRIEEKVSEQASSVSVVGRETIELKTPSLAGELLQGLPGVNDQRSGSAGSRENIKIRGGSATGTLVLIDGFPVNSPTLGQFDISSLPGSRFERIEVVRGAQSALYGSNAMSGVVNFLPPSPREGGRVGTSFSTGSYSTFQWDGFAEGGGRNGSFHAGGTGLASRGLHENDDTVLASFLGGGDVRAGDRSRLHFLLMATDSTKGVPIDFGSPSDVNHRWYRQGILAGARWETRFSPSLSISASGSTYKENSHELDPADPGEVFPYVFDDRTKTRKDALGVTARMTRGEVSDTFLGVEFLRDRATDTLRSNFGNTDSAGTTINRSVFLQQEWRPLKGTGVSLGVRVDGNSEAGTEVNPRLALFRELGSSGVRLRAAAGRGFRTPTVAEKSDPTIGNPDLVSEVTMSYEAGADAVLAGGEAVVSATWFYQSFRDLIQYDGSVPGPVGFGELRNSGHAFSRGVETSASWNFMKRAAAEVAYTYTDTRDASTGERILGHPTHIGSAALILTPVPGLTCRADWLVESDMLDAPPNGEDPRRPGFARVDLYARYRWKTGNPSTPEIALHGKIRNLTDRRYEERVGYPAPGINFLVGLEMAI